MQYFSFKTSKNKILVSNLKRNQMSVFFQNWHHSRELHKNWKMKINELKKYRNAFFPYLINVEVPVSYNISPIDAIFVFYQQQEY